MCLRNTYLAPFLLIFSYHGYRCKYYIITRKCNIPPQVICFDKTDFGDIFIDRHFVVLYMHPENNSDLNGKDPPWQKEALQ